MNKYAIYCNSLEEEHLLKNWIEKEFNTKYYSSDIFREKNQIFNFPNFDDKNGFKAGYHTGHQDGYTRIHIKDFLKEYYMTNLPEKWFIEVTDDNFDIIDKWVFKNKNYHPAPPKCVGYKGNWSTKKTDFLGDGCTEITTEQFKTHILKEMKKELKLPIIYGKPHQLQSFVEDCKEFGYKTSATFPVLNDSTQIKLGALSNTYCPSEANFKTLSTSTYEYNVGKYDIIKFNLPQDYSKALDFMKENMEIWKSLQEPEFKVGDWVYAEKQAFDDENRPDDYIPVFQIQDIFIGNNTWLRPIQNATSGVNAKFCRKATPEEIEEYNNKPKIFKMTSSSGDFKLEVSKKGIYYRPEDSWVDPTSIEKMLLSAIPVYGKFNSRLPLHTYTMEFETVKVGCKSGCSVKAWKEVYDYYKSLQK